MRPGRALAGLLLPLALLAVAGSAALAAADPVQRLTVHVGYPTAGADVVLYEDPQCATHELIWQGGWFTLADASRWAASGAGAAGLALWQGNSSGWLQAATDGAPGLAARPAGAATGLAAHGAATALDAQARAPAWLNLTGSPYGWAMAQVGHEDDCALSLASVSTGLG